METIALSGLVRAWVFEWFFENAKENTGVLLNQAALYTKPQARLKTILWAAH